MLMTDGDVFDGCFSKKIDNLFVVDVSAASIMIAGSVAKAIDKNDIFNACLFK